MNTKGGKAASSTTQKEGDIKPRRISGDPMLTAQGVVSAPEHLSWAEIEDDRGSPNTITGR
jgi:hypothetical protein